MIEWYICMYVWIFMIEWVSELVYLLLCLFGEFGKQLFIILGGVDWVIKWVDLLGGVFVWWVCLVSLYCLKVLWSIVKYCVECVWSIVYLVYCLVVCIVKYCEYCVISMVVFWKYCIVGKVLLIYEKIFI